MSKKSDIGGVMAKPGGTEHRSKLAFFGTLLDPFSLDP